MQKLKIMEDVQGEKVRIGNDLKIIIVGNISTGKTSIINRYINDKYEENCRATIAAEFSYKIIKVKGVNYRLQFWDLPGQERNPVTTSIFCKDSNAVIFCCEVNNEKSRKDILQWESSVKNNIDINSLPKILVENKCDLLGTEEKYNEGIEELKQLSDSLNLSGCFRTSALNGYNIENAIKFLVDQIVNSLEDGDIEEYKYGNRNSVSLDKSSFSNDKKRCC